MEKAMLAFGSGVVAGSLHLSLQTLPGISTGIAIALICGLFVLSGGLVSLLLLGAGLLWFHFWSEAYQPRLCTDFAWFLCQSPVDYEPGYRLLAGSWLGWRLAEAQTLLDNLCRAWHPVWGPWALGLLGGQSGPENKELSDLYRRLGLLHVLVISGSHFIYLSRFIGGSLGLPARLLYALRCISFRHWLTLDLMLQMLTLVILCFYALVVGFSAPCQRAFIFILLRALLPLYVGRWSSWQLLGTAAFVQALLFPLSFVSLSNVLSWSTAAVLTNFPRSGWWPSMPRELAMGLLAVTYFGTLSPIGLLLNPLLEPVWGPVLLLAAVALLGVDWQLPFINASLFFLHEQLERADAWQHQLWGGTYLALAEPFEGWLRPLTCVLSLLWLFRRPGLSAPLSPRQRPALP